MPIDVSNVIRSDNAYASSTLKLDAVPDVFVEFVGSRFEYCDQYGRSVGRSWSSSAGLDLSKYLPLLSQGELGQLAPSPHFRASSLRAMYRYQSGMDFVMPGHGGPTGHFVGLSFRTALD